MTLTVLSIESTTALRLPLTIGLARQAPWTIVTEQGAGHECENSSKLIAPYLLAVQALNKDEGGKVRPLARSPPLLTATQLARSSVQNHLTAQAELSPALTPASRAHTVL